jgi:hypothetical protein
MGLSLQPDMDMRLGIIPVPIRILIMLPYGGIVPGRFYTVLIIMPRGRSRPAGTMRLRRTGRIPILMDTKFIANEGSEKVHPAGTVILSDSEESRAGDR